MIVIKMNYESMLSPANVLAKAILNIAEQLQLTESELATIVGLLMTDRARTLQEDLLKPHTTAAKRALLLVRVYQGIYDLNGGDIECMRHFINSPNRLLDHQSPRMLIQTEQGLSKVVDLLEGLQQHI